MPKKYEFTGETKNLYGQTMHRIRAVRDIYRPNKETVRKGTVGGWVRHEDNLSHAGSCWIADEGIVSHDACVADDAQVSENARLVISARACGSATICGHAVLSHDSEASGKAVVSDHAMLCDYARARGSATVTCHTIVRGYGRVEGSALLRHYTRVGDHAVVKGRCNISGAVYLGGRTVVTGDAILVGGALFNSSAPVTIDRTPPTAMRSDGYQFVLVPYGEDKTLHVFAGCRRFTIAEARRHWRATRGGTPLGDESLAIVAHLARMAKIVWPEFET